MAEDIGYSTIVKRNIQNSIKEGAADASKVGIGESYISAFAVKVLNANAIQIGLLSSLPLLLGYLSDLFSINVIDKVKERKKIVLGGMLINALSFIPIFLSFFVKGYEIPFLIFFVTIYFVSAIFIMPAWISIMGDIIHDRIKGRFFGERNKITTFVSFVALVVGGVLLQNISGISMIYAFGAIFFLAMISKLIGFYYFSKIYEPVYVSQEFSKFGFIDFLKHLRSTNFGIFVIYMFFFTIAYRVAAPFFVVYMFRDLNFSFMDFTLITASSVIATILSMPVWGKYVDQYGNKKIIAVTAFLIPLIPVLWMISENFVYLFIIELFSGFVWAGFNLATFNFVFDATSSEKRARAYSYYNVLVGIAIFIGSMIGSYLINFGTMFKSSIFLVFIISAILRFLVSATFIPLIKETKKVGTVSGIRLLWMASAGEIWRSLHRIGVKSNVKQKKSLLDKIADELAEIMDEDDAGGRI